MMAGMLLMLINCPRFSILTFNYLINTPGPCTGEALRAYKSLEAYNYFVCDHFQNIKQHDLSETSPVAFVTATVAPGQRIKEEKYKPWVCVSRNGCIVATHCTCAAGLGEACSHIAALLFAIESITQSRDRTEVSCTDISHVNGRNVKSKT